MTYTKPLTKLSNKDVATAGGKGASLGELMRADISVPNGFVVLTDSFDKFIDETDLRQEIRAQLNKADQNKMHTIERASERIQSMILRAKMPKEITEVITKDFFALGAKYVAVRSSATAEDSDSAAWAGQLDTYLNTTEQVLLENVKKCWASLFTPRAIFYRFEKGFKESNVSVAVVVQEMIESEKAGIAFSVHPVTQDKNQMIIEAGFGLGEAVVSGTITPDAYVVSKKNNEIIDINIHNQTKALYRKDGGGNEWVKLNTKGKGQVLNKKDILKLTEIIKKIEEHYKTPQDIEWAFANGKFYITQSRPITTLQAKKSKSKTFIDLDEWQYEFQQRNDNPVIMSDTWTRSIYTEIEKELRLPVGKLDYLLVVSAKGYVKKKQKEKIIEQLQKSTVKDEYLQYVYDKTKKRMFGLRRISNQLLKHVDDKSLNKNRLAIIWNNFDKEFIKVIPWFFIPWYVTEENILSNRVKQGLEKYKNKIEKITDFNNALALLMFPVKETLFQKEQKDLFKLVKIAQEKKSFEKDKLYLEKAQKYLDEFAWMTTYIFVPLEKMTLGDLNKKVHQSIKSDFVEQYTLQEKAKTKNKKNTQQILKIIGKDKKLFNDVAWAREYAWLLTYSVEHAFISFANLIPFCKFLANNLGVTYKEWSLFTTEEIVKSLKGEIKLTKTEIQKRKVGHAMLIENSKQSLLVGKQAVDTSNWIDENVGKIKEHVNTISGQPAYPGQTKGAIYIAKNAKSASGMSKGRVLVCPMTTPDYVPSMRNAAAIITDEGGLLSHAAIISRELGVPCVVGTKIATRVLKDGDLVEVNANEGFVRIIEKFKSK